jgi:hypothetical protein
MYLWNVKIHEDIWIEELVDLIPESVGLLKEYGLPCIICGEPIWGTLQDLAKSKGLSEELLHEILTRLQAMHDNA